jgi:hypothetical protein
VSNLIIAIPDSLRASLDEIGRQKDRPIEDVALEMLEKALFLERFRQLRQEFRPYAQKAGFQTDEDVFKAIS